VPTESVIRFRTLDGLHLAGTFVSPDAAPDRAAVLVHGGGVTREEGGSSPGWLLAWVRRAWRRCALTCAGMVRAKGGRRN
jgi:hypothetical protein